MEYSTHYDETTRHDDHENIQHKTLYSDPFWIISPTVLFKAQIVPDEEMSIAERLNAYMRLLLILVVILYINKRSLWWKILLLCTCAIVLIYYLTPQSDRKTKPHSMRKYNNNLNTTDSNVLSMMHLHDGTDNNNSINRTVQDSNEHFKDIFHYDIVNKDEQFKDAYPNMEDDITMRIDILEREIKVINELLIEQQRNDEISLHAINDTVPVFKSRPIRRITNNNVKNINKSTVLIDSNKHQTSYDIYLNRMSNNKKSPEVAYIYNLQNMVTENIRNNYSQSMLR